jgi:hypothetical protein
MGTSCSDSQPKYKHLSDSLLEGSEMTTDQLIAIGGQAATWLTAVLIFFTLREMALQRRYAYKPDIVLVDTEVRARSEAHGTLQLPIRWMGEKNCDENAEASEIGLCSIPLLNLGLGAAKRIDLRWEFDWKNTLKHVNNFCEQHSVPIRLTIAGDGMTVHFENSQSVWINTTLKQSVDYLLPAGSGPQTTKINLPYHWLMLGSIATYLHKAFTEEDEDDSWLPYFPPASVHIDYVDLENKKHIRKYGIRMEIIHIETKGKRNESTITFEGRIRFDQ